MANTSDAIAKGSQKYTRDETPSTYEHCYLNPTLPTGPVMLVINQDSDVSQSNLSMSLGNLWVNTGISVGNPQV